MGSGSSRAQLASHNRPWEDKTAGPAWLRRTPEAVMEVISRHGTTAQIDPLRFCAWLLERCRERGVRVHQPARAVGVLLDGDGDGDGEPVLGGVRIEQEGEEGDCEWRDSGRG